MSAPLSDDQRDRLAEAVCSAICEGDAPLPVPNSPNPRHRIAACYEHQRATENLAPVVAAMLAEARAEALRENDSRCLSEGFDAGYAKGRAERDRPLDQASMEDFRNVAAEAVEQRQRAERAEAMLAEARAEAWDEGEQAGRANADDGYPDPMVENPYRAALADPEADQ